MSRSITLSPPLAAALLAVGMHGVALGVGPAPESSAPAPAASSKAAVSDVERQGEELFGRNCQLCHNSRAKGGKGPQLVKGAWGPGGANTDDYMFGIIKNGRPNTQMGGFGGSLSDAEIRVIIAFLRAESVRVKAAERKAADADHESW
jgi:mono/diheme cytochrome c family protein